MQKRKLDVVVISDVHLGSPLSRANELNEYLKGIETPLLVLNGDFLDVWQLKMKFLPPSHIQVIRRVLKMLRNGTKVVYLIGNHDEVLRQYGHVEVGTDLVLSNEYVIETPFSNALLFHGDIFDHTVTGTGKIIGKIGSKAYNLLFAFNRFVNWVIRVGFNRKPIGLARELARRNNRAVAKAIQFEKNVVDFAHSRGFDTVIVGHSHVPMQEQLVRGNSWVKYLNSGDWTENMTSLELAGGKWSLHEYDGPKNLTFKNDPDIEGWSQHLGDVEAMMDRKGMRPGTPYTELKSVITSI